MGYKINKKYHAKKGRYSTAKNKRKYIVIHNTGNTASALNEAKNVHNNSGSTSFHIVLDGSGTLYRCCWFKRVAYSVGTGGWKNATPYIRNNESINIEVCSNGKQFTTAEKQELRWIVKKLMKKYNIPAKNVVRHWDAHSGRKCCPAAYCSTEAKDKKWKKLHEYITT